VGNWKNETHLWALHPVSETKLCIYRPCLLDMGPDTHLSQRSAVDQKERAEYSRTQKNSEFEVKILNKILKKCNQRKNISCE
jgi:hypothetical protein